MKEYVWYDYRENTIHIMPWDWCSILTMCGYDPQGVERALAQAEPPFIATDDYLPVFVGEL
jgi:hypothetical protein